MAVLAQSAPTSVDDILGQARNLLNSVIVLLFIVATVIFLWGVIKFIMSAEDEKSRVTAKNIMTWGIVGLIVMVAAWGIVLAVSEFFIGTTEPPIPVGPVVPPLP